MTDCLVHWLDDMLSGHDERQTCETQIAAECGWVPGRAELGGLTCCDVRAEGRVSVSVSAVRLCRSTQLNPLPALQLSHSSSCDFLPSITPPTHTHTPKLIQSNLLNRCSCACKPSLCSTRTPLFHSLDKMTQLMHYVLPYETGQMKT